MSYIKFMKTLSTKWFRKWLKKTKIKNREVLKAVDNLENNLSTADLGSGLYKIRVGSTNRGKSSAFRTIVVYKKEDRAVFIYGFAKNEKSNIDKSELQYFKKLGKDLLSLDPDQLQHAIEQQTLFELEV